ncbi:efflux RND transporter periplasmic adaptor subunit [Sphingomonas sp. LHG3406-1]|uniref:efflux RND transporter periplasmic adaptor subunit n=1 Tax=Sphingomonas sp. LHG3406-1 TaxID=2804617 RepID=UPI00262232AA|nr:efflux RND transporter periplasmic adaptor subunit [Sphingomonas sp. LHG3406-1]
MPTLRDLKIINLTDRNRLLAGIAATALVAGVGGVLIGRSMSDPAPVVEASAEPAEETEEEHGPEGFVPLTPERLAASGIALERVEPGWVQSEVIAQATVAAPPEGQALLTARADGAVVRINKRLGDPVGAGETVALLESREAAAFVAERNAAAARAHAARAAAAREQRLFDAKITARQDLEAAVAARRTAEAELQRAEAAVSAAGVTGGGRYLAVRSPIGGRITEVDTQLGAYVSAGAELFNVADPRRLQIDASVPVSDAQRIQPGDRAQVELPTGGVVEARVRSVTPALDAESRTATVVLQLSGAPGGLTQGQGVRVRIVPRESQQRGIILPEEAVQQIEGRDMVFVTVKGGVQSVPVTLGTRSGGRVEIVDGLEAGQTVVTRNAFALKSQLGAEADDH